MASIVLPGGLPAENALLHPSPDRLVVCGTDNSSVVATVMAASFLNPRLSDTSPTDCYLSSPSFPKF